MAKKLFFILSALFLATMCLSFSFAQITVSSPEKIYSLGDEMKIQLSASETQDIEGIMSLTLKCDSYEVQFFTTSVKLNADEPKDFIVEPLRLEKEGNCKISAELKKINQTLDSMETSEFEIENAINITLELNKDHFSPSETLDIIGAVNKANGQQFSGVGIVGFEKNYNLNIKNGKFSTSIAIDSQIKSGMHLIAISIKDDYGNNGVLEKEIYVQAIPTRIDIGLDKEKFFPGDNISASASLYDQAGDDMNGSVIATLYNPEGIDMATKSVSGDTLDYALSSNAPPGNWWIYTYSEGIKERKFFYVEKVEKIDVSMVNNTLRIKNSGNVEYKKSIEVKFFSDNQNVTKLLDLSIPLGKESTFSLNAPDGDYNITIKAGDSEESFYASLSGNAIAINNTGIASMTKQIIVLAFIFLVILFAFVSRFKTKDNRVNVKIRKAKFR